MTANDTLVSHCTLNNDSIGYVEMYDFSTSNRSYEDRVEAVQLVASVCYNSTIKEGSDRLFKMLSTESKGLPSSSYEFVPVLLTKYEVIYNNMESCIKYGELVDDGKYVLTNLRALIADVGDKSDLYYNTTDEEIAVIKKYFKVFKSKIDIATARQLMRHRVVWQELSRRYVSGDKLPFEFYIPQKVSDTTSVVNGIKDGSTIELDTIKLTEQCVKHYNELIISGIKPEDARRVLPQSMYTTVWSAWLPSQLQNMIELRTHKTAQSEIRELANKIDKMLQEISNEK